MENTSIVASVSETGKVILNQTEESITKEQVYVVLSRLLNGIMDVNKNNLNMILHIPSDFNELLTRMSVGDDPSYDEMLELESMKIIEKQSNEIDDLLTNFHVLYGLVNSLLEK